MLVRLVLMKTRALPALCAAPPGFAWQDTLHMVGAQINEVTNGWVGGWMGVWIDG